MTTLIAGQAWKNNSTLLVNKMLEKSWVESANSADTHFPLNNLPYGVFSVDDGNDNGNADKPGSCGVAIGDRILDVAALERDGVINLGEPLLQSPGWNNLMAADSKRWQELRVRLKQLLAADSAEQTVCEKAMVDAKMVQLHMPFEVCEFTDFYSGRHHATNVGTMFRGAENALPPNWLHMPIGYNGRASSVVVSGTDIKRPHGQLKSPQYEKPVFKPSRRFDIELEMGVIVGTASTGHISVAEADDNIFGYVLLNDWSARDIQAFEYQPLGPFQAKATATSISPWIVTKSALEPFRVSTPERELPLLEHLQEPRPLLYDIDLAVDLQPASASHATTICQTNFREMYYSPAQQLAHHSSSGCPMRSADLLGSGTISGAEKHQRGSLLELSWGGKEPLTLDTGETRTFLEDGDTVVFHGVSRGAGYNVGFGSCHGRIVPA